MQLIFQGVLMGCMAPPHYQRPQVRIGFDPDPRQNPVCGMQQRVLPAGSRRMVKCGEPMPGSVVGVVLPSGQALTLCEVEAFGPFRW